MEGVNVATIYLVYLDGETVDVSIREDGLNDFFDSIEKGRPYIDELTKCGFYAPKNQIRYVSFKVSPYEAQEPAEEKKPVEPDQIQESPAE